MSGRVRLPAFRTRGSFPDLLEGGGLLGLGCRSVDVSAGGLPGIGLGGRGKMYAVDVGPDSSGIAHGSARSHGINVKKIAFERLLGLLVGGELVAVAARGAP